MARDSLPDTEFNRAVLEAESVTFTSEDRSPETSTSSIAFVNEAGTDTASADVIEDLEREE